MATPLRNVRVPDDVWQAAQAAAAANGTTVSAVIVDRLERYVARQRRQQPVRCEHEHDHGRAHPLSVDCVAPHFV